MKKIITAIGLITLLTACSEERTKTIVVDQNGKVIEEKVGSVNRFIPSGEITVQGLTDAPVYIDTQTGCKYIWFQHGITPLYDEFGDVEGCKSVNKKETR